MWGEYSLLLDTVYLHYQVFKSGFTTFFLQKTWENKWCFVLTQHKQHCTLLSTYAVKQHYIGGTLGHTTYQPNEHRNAHFRSQNDNCSSEDDILTAMQVAFLWSFWSCMRWTFKMTSKELLVVKLSLVPHRNLSERNMPTVCFSSSSMKWKRR